MSELKVPTLEELAQLKESVKLTPDEETYWTDMLKRMDAQFSQNSQNDFEKKIDFYLQELEATTGIFGKRVAVERRLKYLVGHAHEWMGTHGMDGHEPLKRAEMFEKAVMWYQLADETIGFYSDYTLRQAESCFGAAKYRKDAGLEDQITEGFAERGVSILNTVIGGLSGGTAEVTIVSGAVPEYLKLIATKKITGSVAEAYIIEPEPDKQKLN